MRSRTSVKDSVLVMTMTVVIRVIAVWTCIPLWYVEISTFQHH